MSYGAAAALQQAVYQALVDDTGLDALVHGAIYDAMPSGTLPSLYVTLGPEEARASTDNSGGGAWHRFTVSVVTDSARALALALTNPCRRACVRSTPLPRVKRAKCRNANRPPASARAWRLMPSTTA